MKNKTFHRYYKLAEKVRAQSGWRLCNKWARQRVVSNLLQKEKEKEIGL